MDAITSPQSATDGLSGDADGGPERIGVDWVVGMADGTGVAGGTETTGDSQPASNSVTNAIARSRDVVRGGSMLVLSDVGAADRVS